MPTQDQARAALKRFAEDDTFRRRSTAMPTQDQARAALKRLAEDADFREQVKTDPAAALSEYGFRIDPASVPKQGIKLPDRELIMANLDRMSGDLNSRMAILFFEA
jgi:putative modified peptide